MARIHDWADVVAQIKAHRADGHHLVTVERVAAQTVPVVGVHLAIHDPGLYDEPICGAFESENTRQAPRDASADCIVCLALMREAHGVDTTEHAAPPLDRDVWKLKTFDNRTGEWITKRVGGEEVLSQALLDMLRWKGEGRQVRLEWSELN